MVYYGIKVMEKSKFHIFGNRLVVCNFQAANANL